MNLVYLSDNLVRMLAPTDRSNDTPLSTGTVTARLFDADASTFTAILETRLTADLAAAGVLASVVSTALFRSGDTVQFAMEDGTLHQTTVAAIPSAVTLQLAVGPTLATRAGTMLRRRALQTTEDRVVIPHGLPLRFPLGATVEVIRDDGTRVEATVNARGEQHLLLSATVGGACGPGRRVRRKLGANVAMTAFGTPVAYDPAFGFQGTVPETQADLRPGLRVEIEVAYADAGKELVDRFFALVV